MPGLGGAGDVKRVTALPATARQVWIAKVRTDVESAEQACCRQVLSSTVRLRIGRQVGDCAVIERYRQVKYGQASPCEDG